jgi:AAA domain
MTDFREQEAEFRDAKQAERRARDNGKPDDVERERVLKQEEWRHEARTQIAQREAREAMVLPDTPPTRRLSDELRETTVSPPLHIDQLCGQGHNTVLSAQWKAGKTTTTVARVRAEVDGTPFLGEFATRPLYGNVGFWNNELEPHDMLDYFRRSGVVNTDKIAVEHLKDRRVPLLSDVGAEWTIKWLRDRDVESWVIDPWAVLCSWAGANEYLDPEVGPLLERLDAIKRESDVQYIHICHHTGAGNLNRPRGAARLSDWADAIWNLAREGDKRYFSAIGRRVELAEGGVQLEDNGALIYAEGGRREQRVADARDEIVAHVTNNPGCKTGDAIAAISSGSNDIRQAAMNSVKERGLISWRKQGPATLLLPPSWATDEQLEI